MRSNAWVANKFRRYFGDMYVQNICCTIFATFITTADNGAAGGLLQTCTR